MIGRTVGHYEITAKLGEGGMGQVFRATDARLGRDVAIKVLPTEFANDEERLARFRREARLLASLNHTHIASLHGLEEIDGQFLLVMELVEGEDLSVRLARGPIDQDEALEYARQFAEGLEAAHERGIVHRDLKPANLKINADGQLKILDFGLGRAFLGDSGKESDVEHSPTITTALTGHGVILGTAAYMSPEQARGRKVDQRSDIWSFGTILFEMLTGRRVFEGETISDTMAAVLRADPPWDLLPKNTPDAVRRLLRRCLERDSRRRLRDIGEARVRLERWREDPASLHESVVSGSSISGPVGAATGRRPSIAWFLFAAMAVVAGFFAWRATQERSGPTRILDLELALMDPTQLTGFGNGALLSPDGRWIALLTNEGIWLRDTTRREPRMLPQSANSVALCFSPDSQWLAFSSGGELLRVSVSGGTPISICEMPTPRGVAWVDATTIVYTPSITTGLMWVDVTNGQTHELTSVDTEKGERSHRWPTPVPGQRAVVFECQYLGRDYDESDIQWMSLDGGERRTIYRGGAAPRITDRDVLLFVRDNSLFAVRVDASTGTTSGLPIPVRENVVSSVGNQEDDDGSAQYCLDARGTLLYMDTRGFGKQTSRLAWLDIASGAVTAFGPSAQHDDFRLSPDTTMVVLSRHRDGDVNLYVHELATGNETMLTFRPSVEYIGAWSPDSRVFYWSQASESGDRFEVWRRPVDGSAQPEFVATSPAQAGIWPEDVSPDGRTLAVTAWMGATRRDALFLDLENIDAGFTAMAPNDRDVSAFQWFTEGFVIYQESRGDAGSVLMRRFPDDGALWSFPDTDAGYWAGCPVATGDAAILFGPEGIDRFPVSIESGRVRLGNRQTLRIWTMEEVQRILWAEPHPDGKRMLIFQADDPVKTAASRLTPPQRISDRPVGSPELVLVTGWLQEVDDRLRQALR